LRVVFTTSNATWMAGFFPLDGAITCVKYVSMWSIAGITVGRSGVACEKYVVASLRICRVLAIRSLDAVTATYLQGVAQFTGNYPLILRQLILPKVVFAFGREVFDCLPVRDDAAQHVIS